MKNILFLINQLHGGGAEKVISILTSALSEKYNITVAYYRESEKSYDFGEKCKVVKLPDRDINDTRMFTRLAALKKRIQILKSFKLENNIDLSLSMCIVSCFINVMSREGDCIVCSERTSPKKNARNLFAINKYMYSKADGVIFQSRQVQQMFSRKIQDKSCILKNPVRIPEPANPKRSRRIVTMGRLSAQKNQKLLIKSFAKFNTNHPEYTLSIYGEGELRTELQDEIKALDMQDKIILEGNYLDVHERIKDAEMFVLSSDFEGLSNALLECMAMGIACISTKCEGSTDVIKDGINGILVDIGDENGLANAMEKLAEDPQLRKSLEKQAFQDMKAFARERVINDWEQALLNYWEQRENV